MFYTESVHYNHVQEEFCYWLEYFKSRRKKAKTGEDSEAIYVDQEYM